MNVHMLCNLFDLHMTSRACTSHRPICQGCPDPNPAGSVLIWQYVVACVLPLTSFLTSCPQCIPPVMVPRMFSCIKTFLTEGALPSDWTEGIVTMVPKWFGEPSVGNLRPIAL